MASLLERFEGRGSAVGVTIPGGVRKNGVVASAANIHKGWIGTAPTTCSATSSAARST